MTDDEKREQRNKLEVIRKCLTDAVNNIDHHISDLCHTFTEEDLIELGWQKGNFSGPYMAYEYRQNRKYIVFLDKSGEVLSYSGSPTRKFKDKKELIEYLFE